jgi:hypothetical protein
LRDFVFEGEPDTFEIDVDGAVPIFFGLFRDGNAFALNARVIEGDVEAAKFFDSFVDERLNIGGLRHIRFHE